ncbi:hypothetical protein PAXINDRAFT_172813 [Paxillus involutus ATCC 200175]|uniref:NACHT domain-containing protein n=1 Tax=Paxillus involutus ATCC 200175 TaxID=664439 RepID=A0A0C9SZJ9_PAXIN|nr:hypothetical protein PAXINDRAFT_172813 [Paxillus involutus ATCC 200175]
MFNNSTNVDASHSTFSEVHRDQYYNSRVNVQGSQTVNTTIHGNQVFQGSQTGLEALQKASALSALYDSAERYPAPQCLKGTRVQLLDRLSRWMEDANEKPICWVNGRPGSGKSAVSQTVAEKYASQKRLAASFFFSRRDIERRTTRHFFPTIATQFLSSIPSVRPAIVAALEQDYMIPSKVLREQMQKLLLEPLSSGLELLESPLLIIVDALDECDDPRLVSELVSLLAQLLRDSPVPFHLLITSRAEPSLQAQFRQPDIAPLTVPLEMHTFDAEDDIRSFLQHALDEVYDQHLQVMQHLPRPWPSPEDLDRIVNKASGLFIFALTVVKFVGDRTHNPVHRLQAILEDKTSRETAYAELDSLYLDAISTFPDPDTVRLILGIVYCMPVPVAVAVLHKLLDRPDVDARIVIPALGSVLLSSENGEQPIQFYHASFRDFLVAPQRSRKYCVDPIVYHRLMAQLSLKTMVHSLKRNMCGIDDPSQLNRDIEHLQERREAAYDEALLYACRYWAHHLTQLPSKGSVYEGLLSAMQEFCDTALLYWIEAASIFNDIESAVMKLRSALTWIKSLENVPKDTAALLEDAERLVLLYREPISQCALHVYHTAITFAPSSSAIYTKFKHEAGTSFTITHNQDDEWVPYQYAIDLGSINSVAFSPDGNIVATAGDNHGVQLWNVVTGGNVASLGDRSGSSLLVRFASSGAFVAAAFEKGMVAVWDPIVGREHFKDSDAHSDEITCLEFSPDNTLLASGARDHTLQLWSLETAQRLHKLVAHEGPVTSLAFTGDSQRLCSGSEDNLLIIWDTKSGKLIRGMMGHHGAIKSLDISADGNLIATASKDKTIKLWDARSGTCTRTVSKGHQKTLRSVHFFDEDKRFISASDATILTSSVSTRKSSSDVAWDLGKTVQAMMGNAPIWQAKLIGRGLPAFLLKKMVESDYEDDELLVAYASRSSCFAFSLADDTWCGTLGSAITSPPVHTSQSYLKALAISPDGTRIAAATAVGSLEILDPTVPRRTWDEQMKRAHAVPLHIAIAVVSSPNGERYLVNSSLAWYLVDSQFRPVEKVDFGFAEYARDDEVKRPVFSGNSGIFAWAMSDIWERQSKTSVRVYEASSGSHKVRFNGLKKVQAFVLSPDGNLIACGHEGAITVCDVGQRVKRALSVADDVSIAELAFAPDSRSLVSVSKTGVVQIWDPSSGVCQGTVEGHTASPATAVALAPLGGIAVTGHEDGTIRLLSLSTSASHDLVPSGQAFTQNIDFFKFSDDGLILTCRAGDGTVSTWTIPSQLFSSAPEGGENKVPCSLCDQQVEVPAQDDSKVSESSKSPPHLISQSDKHVFDCFLRTTYMIRKDGWVCKDDKRLFWLPQHMRPSGPGEERGADVFSALNDKMMILTNHRHPLFVNLHSSK